MGTVPGVRLCAFPPTGRPVTVPEAPACQTGTQTDVKGKGDQRHLSGTTRTPAPSGAFGVQPKVGPEQGTSFPRPLLTVLQLSRNSYTLPCAKHQELQGLRSAPEDLKVRLLGVGV